MFCTIRRFPVRFFQLFMTRKNVQRFATNRNSEMWATITRTTHDDRIRVPNDIYFIIRTWPRRSHELKGRERWRGKNTKHDPAYQLQNFTVHFSLFNPRENCRGLTPTLQRRHKYLMECENFYPYRSVCTLRRFSNFCRHYDLATFFYTLWENARYDLKYFCETMRRTRGKNGLVRVFQRKQPRDTASLRKFIFLFMFLFGSFRRNDTSAFTHRNFRKRDRGLLFESFGTVNRPINFVIATLLYVAVNQTGATRGNDWYSWQPSCIVNSVLINFPGKMNYSYTRSERHACVLAAAAFPLWLLPFRANCYRGRTNANEETAQRGSSELNCGKFSYICIG